MPRIQPTVLVLWGERCDELVACTFVTVLRRASLRVKLVGVSGRRNRGASGLTLTPDLSLREALPLAPHVVAVVIPCEGGRVKELLADIRMIDFLESAAAGRAHFVGPTGGLEGIPVERCIEYGFVDGLVEVAQALSDRLAES